VFTFCTSLSYTTNRTNKLIICLTATEPVLRGTLHEHLILASFWHHSRRCAVPDTVSHPQARRLLILPGIGIYTHAPMNDDFSSPQDGPFFALVPVSVIWLGFTEKIVLGSRKVMRTHLETLSYNFDAVCFFMNLRRLYGTGNLFSF
jgi:hypothetical protein